MKLFTVLLQRWGNSDFVVTAFDGAKIIARGTSCTDLEGAFEDLASKLPSEYRPTDN
jgi:hypothetical protein